MESFEHSRSERKISNRKSLFAGFALGTLVGSALGATLGILFAPRSGKNTRQKIYDRKNKMISCVENNMDTVKTNIGNTIHTQKVKIHKKVNKIPHMNKSAQEEVTPCASENQLENPE